MRLIRGDCVEAMRELDAESIDAVVTDPPYGLSFMGKPWDDLGELHEFQAWTERWAREALRVLKPGGYLLSFAGTRTYHRMASGVEDAGFEVRDCVAWLYGSGFPKSLDVSKAIDKRRDDYEDVCAVALWLRPHVERVGFAVVTERFGFKDETMARARWTSRSQPQVPTWDQWLDLKALCGFGDEMDPEVWRLNGRKGTPGEAWGQREKIGEAELVGTSRVRAGFAGAAYNDADDVGATRVVDITAPATDDARRWQGWGTALKPAFEPVVVARKPLIGTVAANVLAHGTGALNIDGCRIEAHDSQLAEKYASVRNAGPRENAIYGKDGRERSEGRVEPHELGRWPANVILDADAAAVLDEQSGELHSQDPATRKSASKAVGVTEMGTGRSIEYADAGGASRFYYVAKSSRSERNAGLDGFEKDERVFMGSGGRTQINGEWVETHSTPRLRANVHPTVKPIDLMRHLTRLVTPPGGTVLDPFMGSGSTGCACALEGFDFIGIDRDDDGTYLPIAEARIAFWTRHGEDGWWIVRERDAAETRHEKATEAGQLSLLDITEKNELEELVA